MRWVRALGFFAGSIGLPLLAFGACGGSAGGSSDAGSTQDTGPGCVPLPVDGGLRFVPSNPPTSDCTLTQLEDLWADCFGLGWTSTACINFNGDPSNSPCIRCMNTSSKDPSWGPIVTYPDNHNFANLGGCISIRTGDAGAGGCAQAIQLLQQCEQESCAGCPYDNGGDANTAINDCQQQAYLTTCSTLAAGWTACESANQYDDCIFADFQADFIGLGEIFCAAGVDGGMDGAAESDAQWFCDNTGDAGVCTCISGQLALDNCSVPKPPCCFTFEGPGDVGPACECWPEGSLECTPQSSNTPVPTCPQP